MTGRIFFDTNVVLYSKDARDARKQTIADHVLIEAMAADRFVTSAQVLNEFYVNVTQKLDPGLPRESARQVCRSLAALSCEPITENTIATAWDVQDRFSLSWWDSLIVASALDAECTTLLSEDMQHGLQIDGVTIENPFV